MNVVLKWKDHSPRSFINKVIYEPVPKNKKKGRKVKEKDFIIPNTNDYNSLLVNNFNVKQLKAICKHYKLKVSGNKDEKIHRIYNYLKFSLYSRKIQKTWRGYIIKKLFKLKGIGLKSVNDTDFLTFDDVNKIPFYQKFTFKDGDGFVYTFDIYSLFNLIMKTNNESGIAKNPYTRKELNNNVLYKLNKVIWLTKRVLNKKIKYKFNNDITVLSSEKKLELKAIETFQKIDQLGYITDTKWLLNLSQIRLIRFLRELDDVRRYRAQLTNETRRSICPPNGNPFLNISLGTLMHKSSLTLKSYALDVMGELLKSEDKENRTLGANYILGVLTIVSHNAATALPWLYGSFIPNQNV
jgi:hypothetical protein